MPPESSSQPKQFQCKTCCKSYKKKDSLTRHSHNHQDNQQHVCLECSRNFHRRDILQRHLDLHHTGRTRGVRACERCRVSKVRCDSKTPCARCVKACQICIYSGTGKDGSSTRTISVSEPTLPELPTQHQQSDNGSHNRGTTPDFDASPSKSPQTATNMAQVSIVDEFTTLDPTKQNSCNEGRSTMFSDQRHSDESDTADITMANTVNPLIWGQEGFLAWPSADLFLNDNFIADMAEFAAGSTKSRLTRRRHRCDLSATLFFSKTAQGIHTRIAISQTSPPGCQSKRTAPLSCSIIPAMTRLPKPLRVGGSMGDPPVSVQ